MAIDDKDATDLSVAPVVGPDDPRRFPDSGIEVEPIYGPDDPPAELDLRAPGAVPYTTGLARPRRSRRVPVPARHPPRDVPQAAVDDPPVRRLRDRQGVQRALPLPAGPRRHRPEHGVRPADPARPRLRRPALSRRGGPH